MWCLTITLILAIAGAPSNAQQDCICVPYQNCLIDGTINTLGSGLVDVRLNSNRASDQQNTCHFLETCCASSNIVENTTNNFNNFNNQNNNPNGGVAQNYVSRGCGYRNTQGVGFKITENNEGESQFGEFPWMVAVFTKNANDKIYACGGSLIHRRVVLTAAHCVAGKHSSEVSVRVGEWDTQGRSEPFPHQNKNVSVSIIHPKYQDQILHYDYALLILVNPVELAPNVDTICLPNENDNFDNYQCITTGWGKDKFDRRGRYQSILKSIELSTVPRSDCLSALRKTDLGTFFILHDTFMCAGGAQGVDACTGDGGSPLVCPRQSNPAQYVQAGIVAWGIHCGEQGIPGVYADVAKVRRWIDNELSTYNIMLN